MVGGGGGGSPILGWQRYMDMGGGGGNPSWDGRDTGDAMTGVVYPIL